MRLFVRVRVPWLGRLLPWWNFSTYEWQAGTQLTHRRRKWWGSTKYGKKAHFLLKRPLRHLRTEKSCSSRHERERRTLQTPRRSCCRVPQQNFQDESGSCRGIATHSTDRFTTTDGKIVVLPPNKSTPEISDLAIHFCQDISESRKVTFHDKCKRES